MYRSMQSEEPNTEGPAKPRGGKTSSTLILHRWSLVHLQRNRNALTA